MTIVKMGQNGRQIRQNSLEGKGPQPIPRRSYAEGTEKHFVTALQVIMKYPG